jgi:hypothetical protein
VHCAHVFLDGDRVVSLPDALQSLCLGIAFPCWFQVGAMFTGSHDCRVLCGRADLAAEAHVDDVKGCVSIVVLDATQVSEKAS